MVDLETAVKLSSGIRASFSKNHSDTARREEIAKNETRYVRRVDDVRQICHRELGRRLSPLRSLTATHGPKWR